LFINKKNIYIFYLKKKMKFLLITILALLFSIVIVNANSYESLGVDAAQKQIVEQKILQESSLPVIHITTRNNTELILSREEFTDCVVDVLNVDDNLKLKEQSATIKVRGNSTGFYGDVEQIKNNIVPYRIKFDEKINLLGLHQGEKFNNWVLLKTYIEVIRFDISFRMGRVIFGDEYYSSDVQFVKVYINDEFIGIYVLVEQNEIDEKKVNISIPELNYEGTDIGYYIELDNYFYENPPEQIFVLDYEKATVKDIRGEVREFVEAGYTVKSDLYNEEQLYFIGNYTKNVFDIIYHAVEKGEYKTLDENYNVVNSTYTSAQEAISAVFDINSAVDMYLLYEIIHDYDVGEGSFFFAVDFSENSKIPKLQMVSPWDFDWSYNDSPRRYWAGAFCEKSFASWAGDISSPWFILLAKEEWFHELASKKWESVSASVKAQLIEEKNEIYNNLEDFLLIGEPALDNVDLLQDWISERLEWMDEAFDSNKSVTIIPDETYIVEEEAIEVETSIGLDDEIDSSDDEE